MNSSINYSSFLDLAKRPDDEVEFQGEGEMNKLEKKHGHNKQSCTSISDDAEHLSDT